MNTTTDTPTSTPAKPVCTAADSVEVPPRVCCSNCDWQGAEAEIGKTLVEMHHLWDRISPGEIVPVGECPECGAVAHYATNPYGFGTAGELVDAATSDLFNACELAERWFTETLVKPGVKFPADVVAALRNALAAAKPAVRTPPPAAGDCS